MGVLGQLGPALLKVLPMLDERSRRLVLGMAAEGGKAGTGRVAVLTGASWQTAADGKAGLDAGDEPPPGRQRRPGVRGPGDQRGLQEKGEGRELRARRPRAGARGRSRHRPVPRLPGQEAGARLSRTAATTRKGNAGFVNAGTDGNTAALAVESVRRWWRAVGRDAYPGARRLLVTCDSGGSDGCTRQQRRASYNSHPRGRGFKSRPRYQVNASSWPRHAPTRCAEQRPRRSPRRVGSYSRIMS